MTGMEGGTSICKIIILPLPLPDCRPYFPSLTTVLRSFSAVRTASVYHRQLCYRWSTRRHVGCQTFMTFVAHHCVVRRILGAKVAATVLCCWDLHRHRPRHRRDRHVKKDRLPSVPNAAMTKIDANDLWSFFGHHLWGEFWLIGAPITGTVITLVTANANCTRRYPAHRRLVTNHCISRRSQSAFGTNSDRPHSSLLSPTTPLHSPSCRSAFETIGWPWGIADWWDLLAARQSLPRFFFCRVQPLFTSLSSPLSLPSITLLSWTLITVRHAWISLWHTSSNQVQAWDWSEGLARHGDGPTQPVYSTQPRLIWLDSFLDRSDSFFE